MKRETVCDLPQYEKLLKLFNEQRPSVNLFDRLLAGCPEQEREQYFQNAFFLFINAYPSVSKHYRYFLTNLVKQMPDEFLAYLFQVSGLGQFRCKMEDPSLLIKTFHLLTAQKGNVKASFPLLAFSISLGFYTTLKTKTLGEYVRKYQFYPETFFELAEYVGIFE